MTPKTLESGSAKLAQLLTEMNERGGFPITVLTDQHGFHIASAATPGEDHKMQSAVVALVQKTAAQVRQQLDTAQTDEISCMIPRGNAWCVGPLTPRDAI